MFLDRARPFAAALVLAAVLPCTTPSAAQTSSTPMLTDAERADVAYLLAKMEPMRDFWMDLSDERQYRVLMKQLELAGESPELSPQLFRTLEEQRRRHLAGGFAGEDDPLETCLQEEGLVGCMVSRGRIGHITEVTGNGTGDYSTSAFVSIEGGTLSLTTTLALFNDQSQLIGPVGLGGGTDGAPLYSVATSGSTPASGPITALHMTYYVDDHGGLHGPFAKRGETCDPLPTLTNDAPLPAPGSDRITLCVNRCPGNNNVCTYPQPCPCTCPGTICACNQFDGKILLNVEGSTTFADPVKMSSGKPSFASVTLMVVNTEDGGGCQTWMGPGSDNFFDNPNTVFSNGNKTLSWNLDPGDFAGSASSTCLHPGDKLAYTFAMSILTEGTSDQECFVSVTSSAPTSPGTNTAQIPELTVIPGCLAPGTRVELADGSSMKIEAFEAEGERVRTGSGEAMTVIGNMVGTEEQPLIHLEDSAGHTLDLTQTHPVVTRDRGVRLAKELEVGDWVVTRQGAAQLVRAEPRLYSGPVYNIELGGRGVEVRDDNTTLFANGILVGDSRMQSIYETQAKRRPVNRLAELPPEWYEDYLNELRLRGPEARPETPEPEVAP